LHHFAQDDSISENVLEAASWQLLTKNGLDPSENLGLKGRVTLASNLFEFNLSECVLG
jgi:hypothetical protein